MQTEVRHLRLFAEVAARGSFVAAAEALGTSSSAVSRAVSDLEQDLDTRLLNRSTRRVALTDAGARFLERARHILDELADARAEARAQSSTLSGHLRIHAPGGFAHHCIAPALPAFMAQHPDLEIELMTGDQAPDLISSGFDIVVLARQAQFDAAITARRLLSSDIILCAAPAYLSRRPPLNEPGDIVRHPLLDVVHEASRGRWTMTCGDQTLDLAALRQSHFRTNRVETAIDLALAGCGVAPAPAFMVAEHLCTGRLQQVLSDWSLQTLDFWAALPSRRYQQTRVTLFLDHLTAYLRTDGVAY